MNQESLNNEEFVNNVAPETMQPTYTTPVEPIQTEYVPPVQPAQPMYTAPAEPTQPEAVIQPQQPIEMVSNLNKDDAMEEALSHTNQYTPFEVQQEEVNQETNFMSNKKALVFLGIILGIMLLFIIFLPQISKSFGW